MPLARRKRILVIVVAGAIGAAGLGVGSAYAAAAVRHVGAAHPRASNTRDGGYRNGNSGPGHADMPAAGDSTSADATGGLGTPSAAATTGTPTLAPTPKPDPTARATTKAPTKSPTATKTTGGRPSGPAQNPPSNSAAINAVFAQLNQLRSDNQLPALVLSPGLLASTHAHTLLMLNGCGLNHLCAGEASLGARINAQGVTWTAAAENISSGGPYANTDTALSTGAQDQTTGMYNEVAPDDGHRQNILGPYGHVGIDVVRAADGTLWMTQDFTN
jgi:uncharacterized protein YkwD